MTFAAAHCMTIALCLCACGRVGFDARDDGGTAIGDGSGSAIDAAANSDGGDMCVGAVPATTFPGGFPCTNWGANTQQTNGGLSESNGTLTLTPNANSAGANAGCARTGVTVGAAGAFTEVSQVLMGPSSRTRLEVDWGGVTYWIGAEGTALTAGRPGVTFTGGLIDRWWRIRPADTDLVFETSTDGMTWNRFGSMGGVPTGPATLRVTATTVMAETAPGSARFESVNVCP